MTQLFYGDCLDIMPRLATGSVDMILADLPYGTTACKWDVVIPFAPLWEQYWRVLKPNGVTVLFGSEPFSSHLRMSQIKHFKYDWVWHKSRVVGAMMAKKAPMKAHEIISVFYQKQPLYSPIMTPRTGQELKRISRNSNRKTYGGVYGENGYLPAQCRDKMHLKYPQNVLFFKSVFNGNKVGRIHPTQKPVALLEYLIKTYTFENETVLDNTMGSGSTGVACKNIGRKFIGIEKDAKYFEIAQKRIENTMTLGLT